MLLRLLKSLLARTSERSAGGTEGSPMLVRKSAPPARSPTYSQLDQLSRLATFASGQTVRLSGTETPPDPSASIAPPERPVMEVVAHASRLGGEALQRATERRVQSYAEAFSAAATSRSGLNVFAFHVDLPGDARLNYVDVKINVGDFDYLDILRRFVARIREHCKEATVYLVTSPGSPYRELAAPDVRIVELDVNAAHPMYERATAMLAYAESNAFVRDTVLLDSDALVNRPLQEVFCLGFDIGLTYRDVSGLMPVNEGVIFLSARHPERVRRFLRRRLATYDSLLSDPFVTGYYGDVRRWRGGQLSLNASTYRLVPHSPYRIYQAADAVIRMLPCDTFNFTAGEGEDASSIEHLEDRYVVHFKGMRKYAFGFAAKAEQSSAAG